MIATDTQGVIRSINAGVETMLGYTAAELVGQLTPEVIHDRAEVAARAQVLTRELGRAVQPGFDALVAKARRSGGDENDWTYICKDGSRFPVRLSVTPLTDAAGNLTGFLGIGKDISAQKIAEAALRDSEARLRLITDNLPVYISYIDRERRFRFNNAMYAKFLGRPLDEITGQRVKDVASSHSYALMRPHLDEAFTGVPVTFEFALPPTGHVYRGNYLPDIDADVIGVYGLIGDITAQKDIENKLRQLAQFDSLTGLANRSRFDDKLDEAIACSERSGRLLALMFLDLDDCKSINHRFGHYGGDRALQQFARRLTHSVRSTDTVARLAGDEFVVILELLKQADEATVVAAKLVAAMESPCLISDQPIVLSTSMGIAVRRCGETDGAVLLQRADAALYRAKASGRGCFVVEE